MRASQTYLKKEASSCSGTVLRAAVGVRVEKACVGTKEFGGTLTLSQIAVVATRYVEVDVRGTVIMNNILGQVLSKDADRG